MYGLKRLDKVSLYSYTSKNEQQIQSRLPLTLRSPAVTVLPRNLTLNILNCTLNVHLNVIKSHSMKGDYFSQQN
jgi:hypothetical protein